MLGTCRNQKICNQREEIGGLTILFSKRKNAVRASFRLAHILSKEVKTFSEGGCVKRCILAIVKELCPEKKSSFETVSLLRDALKIWGKIFCCS